MLNSLRSEPCGIGPEIAYCGEIISQPGCARVKTCDELEVKRRPERIAALPTLSLRSRFRFSPAFQASGAFLVLCPQRIVANAGRATPLKGQMSFSLLLLNWCHRLSLVRRCLRNRF